MSLGSLTIRLSGNEKLDQDMIDGIGYGASGRSAAAETPTRTPPISTAQATIWTASMMAVEATRQYE